jgi:RND family efflux transporter MFP subunit
VELGDAVLGPSKEQAAQILVELDTETLDLEIEAARIQQQLAEQALDELRKSLPIEIEMAEAKLAEAKALSEFAKRDFDRVSQLAGQSRAISSTELEQADSQFKSTEQLALQAAHDLNRLEATRDVRIAQATNRVQSARQAIRLLEDQKSKFEIRAPFDGYVANKLTEIGAWVSQGDPIVEIISLEQIEFSVSLPQEHLVRVQEMLADNDQATLTLTVDGMDEPVNGSLRAVMPQIDPRSRQATLRARLANPRIGDVHLLKPGMIGRAHLPVGPERNMVLLPRDAVVLSATSPFVFKVDAKDQKFTAHQFPVRLGNSYGTWVEVIGDLAHGDQVVVMGNERLKDNDEVRVQQSLTAVPPLANPQH